MKRIAVILLFLGLMADMPIQAQTLTRYLIVGGDTLPVVDLPVVSVGIDYRKKPTFRNKREARKYRILRRRVQKVYPYAQLAAQKLNECHAEILANPESKKRAMKKVERALKAQYGPQLKKLTVSQGKMLLLLIDRQTGNTTYELVKELRGSFSAGMYQGIARLFGSSLKVNYDPKGEHWMVEDIVKKIELGVI